MTGYVRRSEGTYLPQPKKDVSVAHLKPDFSDATNVPESYQPSVEQTELDRRGVSNDAFCEGIEKLAKEI